jgi:hypothetical protein
MITEKWVNGCFKLTTFRCSNCENKPLYKPVKRNDDYITYVYLSKYCPYCGCKMEYEEKEQKWNTKDWLKELI